MNKLPLLALSLVMIFSAPGVRGADLTPEQIESLKARIAALRENLDGHLAERNQGAAEVFLSAAGDPRQALELYLKCYKEVHFDREGRRESDFREWREGESNRLEDDAFLESLQLQLLYLGLSCQAAEAKETEDVFAPLMSYLDRLSQMEELPNQILLQSVANSIFAQTYYLERLLGENERWEPTPYNLDGIYEKTILPYLREEQPETLMSAWDKRIQQKTRIAVHIEKLKEEELRGMSRDEERRALNRQNRQGGIMQTYDRDDFERETLPSLHWGKLKDMFLYVDELTGAKEMLDFVEEKLTHPKGDQWFSEFEALVLGGGSTEPAVDSPVPSN